MYIKSWTWLSDFTFTFHFHALEEEMATHSSVLAWRIPGTGEPGGLPSLESHRVGNNWSDLAAAAASIWCLVHINIFWVTKGMVPQEDIKLRARECLCFRKSYQLGLSVAFTFMFCWASFLMYPEHSASPHYLWMWLLVTWLRWISETLRPSAGQEMEATWAICSCPICLWKEGWMTLGLQMQRRR